MHRLQSAAVLLLAGLLPLSAAALGVGEVGLRSALGEPLLAEIPLSAESPDELDSLEVRLAPVETFARFGIDRPAFLAGLRLEVVRAAGDAAVRVSSTEPVTEPFLTVLLEFSWSKGRLLREYTMLLDPPAFAPEQQPAPVALPGAGTTGPAAGELVREEPAPPASQPVVIRGAEVMSSSYGPVQRNETLWGITSRVDRAPGVSMNQMMLAIFRANPEAFDGNINQLRAGAILRIPDSTEIAGVAAGEANAEVSRQNEAWQSGRVSTEPRLRLVPPEEAAPGEPAGAGGAGDAVDGAALAAAEERAAQLDAELTRLQRERDEARQERDAANEVLAVRNEELRQLQERLRALEAAGAEPQAPPPEEVAREPFVEPEPVTELEPAAEPEAERPAVEPERPADVTPETRPEPPPAPKVVPRKPEPPWYEALLTSTWLWLAAAAIVAGGLLFFVLRRWRAAPADVGEWELAAAGGGAAAGGAFGDELRAEPGFEDQAAFAELEPEPEEFAEQEAFEEAAPVEAAGEADATGERWAPEGGTAVARPGPAFREVEEDEGLERTIGAESGLEIGQADALAEADYHMAYGQYDRAAELLTEALAESPDRRDLRLKLLEVYFIWENRGAFLKEAQAFHAQVPGESDPEWSKVAIMGRQICPGEPLFAESPEAGRIEPDFSLDESGYQPPPVDLEVGEASGAGQVDVEIPGEPGEASLDFEVGEPLGEVDVFADLPAADATGTQRELGPPEAGLAPPVTEELPTVETLAPPEEPTREVPQAPRASESAGPGAALPGALPLEELVDELGDGSGHTEEIELEDLGLDLTGLDDAVEHIATGVHESLDDLAGGGEDTEGPTEGSSEELELSFEDDLDLSADLSALLPEAESTAEMPGVEAEEADDGSVTGIESIAAAMARRDTGRDVEAGGERPRDVEAGGERPRDDTLEQPSLRPEPGLSPDEAEAEEAEIDLGGIDIGANTEEYLELGERLMAGAKPPEGPTMTEVGTKLDLARAYIDMGDPEGARSILNEVLEEGGAPQRQEARKLLEDLEP